MSDFKSYLNKEGSKGSSKIFSPLDSNTHRSTMFGRHEINEFSQTFDYCMVFPMQKENGVYFQNNAAKYCVQELVAAGMEVFPYLSVQGDELLVLIRCPLEYLQRFADKVNYKLYIDPATLAETLLAGDPERRIAPIEIKHMPDVCEYSPYEHIYLQFRESIPAELYHVPAGELSPFTKSIRLKLIFMMIRAPKRDGGCDIELTKMLHKKHVLAFFPLHDKVVKKDILTKVFETATFPWSVPVEDIREYFGEKIALYYVFLGHYSLWLILPCIVGLAFQLVVWSTLNFSSPVLPFYSLIITVWAVIMLEFWKRREATTALQWGMSDFEQREIDRPEFKGETIRSYINGSDITYFPPSKYQTLMAFSRTVIAMFVLIVLGVVAGIYVFRFNLQKSSDTYDYASGVASILNTIQITVFNIIYGKAAIFLTNQENHRTDTMYEDSLIVKMFIFQFINSYASFFFLAFIAANLEAPSNAPSGTLGQCGADNCMEPLSINLATIFGSRLTITNFLDIFIPYVQHKQKIKTETKGISEDTILSNPEKDYTLMTYDTTIDSIQCYADTAVQFGFSLLFITALPCASFFSLLNNYVKTKFNMWKLATFYQRPSPMGAQDIGTWQTIFSIISVAAVVTNAGLICFTMDVLNYYSLFGRVWIFIGFQWVLIGIQFLTQAIIDDVPEAVEIQLERTAFLNEKVIEKVEDEDYGLPKDQVESEMLNEGLARGGCCGLFAGKSRTKKIRSDCADVTVFTYPHNAGPSQFPKILNKDNYTALVNSSAAGYTGAYSNYASNVAAVPNAYPEYGAKDGHAEFMQNPVAAVPRPAAEDKPYY